MQAVAISESKDSSMRRRKRGRRLEETPPGGEASVRGRGAAPCAPRDAEALPQLQGPEHTVQKRAQVTVWGWMGGPVWGGRG